MTIDTSKFYFNRDAHTDLAETANSMAAQKNVSVSRWVNNSKGRQIVTYIVHTGARNEFASKQDGILFQVVEDAGRGGRVYDETALLNQVIAYINSIVVETEQAAQFVNTSDRYGDAVTVTVQDYVELNPEGDFEVRYDGIYEAGYGRIAELVE